MLKTDLRQESKMEGLIGSKGAVRTRGIRMSKERGRSFVTQRNRSGETDRCCQGWTGQNQENRQIFSCQGEMHHFIITLIHEKGYFIFWFIFLTKFKEMRLFANPRFLFHN